MVNRVLLACALAGALAQHAPPIQCDVLGLPKGSRKPSGAAQSRRQARKRRRAKA